jgi:hypothetical protein
MGYREACDPDALASGLLRRLDAAVDYRPVASDGAAKAAALLSDLL